MDLAASKPWQECWAPARGTWWSRQGAERQQLTTLEQQQTPWAWSKGAVRHWQKAGSAWPGWVKVGLGGGVGGRVGETQRTPGSVQALFKQETMSTFHKEYLFP